MLNHKLFFPDSCMLSCQLMHYIQTAQRFLNASKMLTRLTVINMWIHLTFEPIKAVHILQVTSLLSSTFFQRWATKFQVIYCEIKAGSHLPDACLSCLNQNFPLNCHVLLWYWNIIVHRCYCPACTCISVSGSGSSLSFFKLLFSWYEAELLYLKCIKNKTERNTFVHFFSVCGHLKWTFLCLNNEQFANTEATRGFGRVQEVKDTYNPRWRQRPPRHHQPLRCTVSGETRFSSGFSITTFKCCEQYKWNSTVTGWKQRSQGRASKLWAYNLPINKQEGRGAVRRGRGGRGRSGGMNRDEAGLFFLPSCWQPPGFLSSRWQ